MVTALVAMTVGSSLALAAGSASAAPDDDVDDIEGIIDASGQSSGSVPETTAPVQPTLVTAVPLPVDPLPTDEPEAENSSTITAINGPATVSVPTTTIPEPAPAARNAVGGTVFVDFNRNGADDGVAADPRAAGVGIIVRWDGVDGQPGTGDDRVFETMTDGNGVFRLVGLHDGGYTVAINPAKIPVDARVTIDPDGGLADATSAVSLAGGATNMSQNFGLATGPADFGDAVMVPDVADAPLVGAAAAPQSSSDEASTQAADDTSPRLPATGRDEALASLYIAVALLLSGLALLAIRGRGSNVTV